MFFFLRKSMKIVALSSKIVPAARPPVRPPSARRPPVRPPPVRPSVRPSTRSGAGRTYIHRTPDWPPWAAVTRIVSILYIERIAYMNTYIHMSCTYSSHALCEVLILPSLLEQHVYNKSWVFGLICPPLKGHGIRDSFITTQSIDLTCTYTYIYTLVSLSLSLYI